jgi:hypothetical protein
MTEPIDRQAPEGVRPRVIWLVGGAVVAISAALVVIAWLLVVPPPRTRPAAAPSTLEHGLFDRVPEAEPIRAAGELRLQRTEWVDRNARVVRIPIERAIDAVVADPSLITAPGDAAASEVSQ